MRWAILIWLIWTAAAVAEPLRILAIGDSVMAWQKWTGRDIPSVMGRKLKAQVVRNAAVPGARFSNTSTAGRALGLDVRSQFRTGDWDLVLVNGGANDMLSDCNCTRCDRVLDTLISADLRGEVPAFVAALRTRGLPVVWMGYYASDRSGQFTGCRPFLVEYDARIARLAARTPGFDFIDSEDAMNPQDRSLYAFDGIHPSARGALRIGTYLALRIAR